MVKGFRVYSTGYSFLCFLSLWIGLVHFKNEFCLECEDEGLYYTFTIYNFLKNMFLYMLMMYFGTGVLTKNYTIINNLIFDLSKTIEYTSEFETIL